MISEMQIWLRSASARDRSGKPEARWTCAVDGLAADSPVALPACPVGRRLAWPGRIKSVLIFSIV
jgi:hypothetical protein